jgi:hypothetical protein
VDSFGGWGLLALQESGEIILEKRLTPLECGQRLSGGSRIQTSGSKPFDEIALSSDDPATVSYVSACHGELVFHGAILGHLGSPRGNMVQTMGGEQSAKFRNDIKLMTFRRASLCPCRHGQV